MTPVSPSLPVAPASPWTQRLVEQLQQLSEVTENLTYRLLELEERVATGERGLAQLREQDEEETTEVPPAIESWLEDTEQRLARVEELLRRGDGRPAAASRTLVAVGPASLARADTEGELPEQDHDPFPEEEEQAFLDEESFLEEQSA